LIYARALLLADGPSDEPLGRHVAALARRHGVRLDVVAPEFGRMDPPPGLRVRDRLARMLEIDPDFEILIVHRDSERQPAADRLDEIREAARSLSVPWPTIPIIPVRMTEAWLLLDEPAIRAVAGRPTGTEQLDLPRRPNVESVPDPKSCLQDALATASGLSGRRLSKFKRDFPAHRRQLLDRLDRAGPVRELSAWRALDLATGAAMAHLEAHQSPGA
jgi:hypothetical protein